MYLGKSSFGLVESSAMLGLLLFKFCRLDFCSTSSTASSTKALPLLKIRGWGILGWRILDDVSSLFAPEKSFSSFPLFSPEG